MKTQPRIGMIKISKIVAYLVFILFLLSQLTLSQAESNDKPLLFLGNQNLAPVVYNKDGLPTGLAVDLVRALEKKMNRPITISCIDWTKAQELVSNGEADALIQINPTEERKKSYDFSDPLLQSRFSIFVLKDRLGITGASSLRGLRVGVEKGGFPHKVLQEDALVHLVLIADFLEGFKMLSDVGVDAVVVDYMVGAYVLAENQITNIRTSGEPIAYLESSIAVKKGNKDLLNEINVALGKIRSDGTYSKVISKWEPKDVIFMTREQIKHRTYAIVTSLLFALFIIAIVWVITLHRELRKRRLAESRLHQKSEELEIFFSTALDLFCIADYEGNLLRINEQWGRTLGYSIDDLKTHRLIDFIHPDDLNRTIEAVSKFKNSENLLDFTNRYLSKDGSYRWIEWRAALSGELIYAAARDVTDRKRAEEKITQLAAIVESSGDAIIGKTLNGTVISWNKGAERIYGYAENEMIGKPISTLVESDNADDVAVILERIRMGEQIKGLETMRRRKDGEIIHLSLGVSPIRDTEGRIVGASTIGRDITERRRAEEEVRKLNQELDQRVTDRTAQLQAANSELEAFAYSISHDLRAPLRHIDGFLELLEKRVASDLDDTSRRYLTNIFDSTKRMGIQIDDLLSFSRMGRYEMSKKKVDLGSLVEEVIGEAGPEASGRTVNWLVADLPVVVGDRAMLLIVLNNLISNALKFTRPRPRPEIEIGCMQGTRAETVVFVRDNGVGFDMKYADKLFSVFQRLHRVDEFEGTGIGLANVRRIINRHGGRTWAEGKIDQGATFYFSLPQPNQGA